MADDRNEITDEVSVSLSSGSTHYDRMPDRPSPSASKADWLDYVVALGASREYLTTATRHFVGNIFGGSNEETELEKDEQGYHEDGPFTKEDLIALADHLEGPSKG